MCLVQGCLFVGQTAPIFLIGFSFTALDFLFLPDRRMRGAADLAPSTTGQTLTLTPSSIFYFFFPSFNSPTHLLGLL